MMSVSREKVVALIPARGGSVRVPRKAIKPLAGHPLIAYTIAAAIESGCFVDVFVATDDTEIMRVALKYRSVVAQRPDSAGDEADITWVQRLLDWPAIGSSDAFAILRPTSPFRTAPYIRLAVGGLLTNDRADSVRGMRKVSEHPAKMWKMAHDGRADRGWQMAGVVQPVMAGTAAQLYRGGQDQTPPETPWHSMPTQLLPEVYVQTAGIEVAWVSTVRTFGTISGERVLPLILDGPPSLDINTPEDWAAAERIAAEHPEALPKVEVVG